MTNSLDCRLLSKRLGGKVVLADLSLSVGPGEVVSILGASGSGKSTLLRIIAGLLDPDAGRIAVNERVLWGPDVAVPPEQRNIGMVFQDYALWPHMTVADNLGFGLKAKGLRGAGITERIRHALTVTQLDALRARYPSELSGGQQQRVAIARCLAARPSLILFDEPLSSLDAALREDLRTHMMTLVRKEGITVVYVTHDQLEAMAVSDRVAVMRQGGIAQFDAPQALYDRPATPFVASFIGGFSLLPGTAAEGMFRPVRGAGMLNSDSTLTGPVMLVVRPEDASPATLYPDNQLAGRVVSLAFQGRCWRLSVDIGGERVRLDWPHPVPLGDNLAFSLAPNRCTLVAADQ